MKDYKHYADLAKLELEREHGRNTVDLVNQLKNSLHTVAQSLIMLDLINAMECKNTTVEVAKVVEEVEEKPTKPRTTIKK
ncbi:MAG: hypothetical protein ACRDBY_04795 [Cetobacterium sp.]